MDTRKHNEFFNPNDMREPIHIIGCGAIGSTIAENLVRLGLTKITLYDYDFVESKNVTNQMYRAIDIGKAKTEALYDILTEINPELKNTLKLEGKYENQRLSGHVFLAVDNIETRQKIVRNNKFNQYIVAIYDFRMGLEEAQHYAADWSSPQMQRDLEMSMDFTQAEADLQTPVSACNERLSVAFTVRGIVTAGIENFVYFVLNRKNLQKSIFHHANLMQNIAFPRSDC